MINSREFALKRGGVYEDTPLDHKFTRLTQERFKFPLPEPRTPMRVGGVGEAADGRGVDRRLEGGVAKDWGRQGLQEAALALPRGWRAQPCLQPLNL